MGHAHSHGHNHSHGHHHRPPSTSAAFRWSVLLNSLLTGLQLVIGFGFGSLALVADALHNLGDVVGLLLGWGAERLSLRPARGRFTYGFGRSTHLAALLNALLVLLAGGAVVLEGVTRLQQPEPMVAMPVAWAALAGIVVNLLSARLFGLGHQHDLNRRAAVLHLLSDAAVSAAVLVTVLLVKFTGWVVLDAVTAIVVGLAVMASAARLLREALHASLDAVPAGLDHSQIEQALLAVPGVEAVLELHVWAVSTSAVALTAHLRCRRQHLAQPELLLRAVDQQLAAFGIRKSTLQLEPAD